MRWYLVFYCAIPVHVLAAVPGEIFARLADLLAPEGTVQLVSCVLPAHGSFSTKAGQVSDLGRATGVIRERADCEFHPESVVAIADQAASRFSSGTWDFTLIDYFDADMAMMSGPFPGQKGAHIGRSPLAPFDRAKAQKWWEDN